MTPPDRIVVVIPTRGRPSELERCLGALAVARERHPFAAFVCDSSPDELRPEVERISAKYPWVKLRFHAGTSISQARNFCARVADADLLVSVDDDVIVEPEAIEAMVNAYDNGSGPRVVGGAVIWGAHGAAPLPPLALSRIGYGRPPRAGEQPDFINSSLLLYPRAYALRWPWSERVKRSSDVLMGVPWVKAGVQLLWAPDALAHHEERDVLSPEQHADYTYAVLAHLVIARPRPLRLALLETLGLAAGVKGYGRGPGGLRAFLRAWLRGHRAFLRDYRSLRELASRAAPPV